MFAGSTLIFATPLRLRCSRFEIKLTTYSMLEPTGVCCKSSARIAVRGASILTITRGGFVSASAVRETTNDRDKIAPQMQACAPLIEITPHASVTRDFLVR